MIGSSKVTTFVLAPILIGCMYWTSSVSGSTNQGCNQTELTTIRQCLSPYNTQFPAYFGTGGTCNRTLITQQVCSYYATIVTCVNSASLSISTCRPYMVSQVDSELGISCKVNDFVVTCTSAPQLNEVCCIRDLNPENQALFEDHLTNKHCIAVLGIQGVTLRR